MPRYDYKCTVCANEFELVQKFSEAGQGECPICGAAGQRVFHAVPVIYKGSGFYTTDYGRPKRPAESSESRESSSESAPSTNGSSSSGDDAKPAEAAPASGSQSSGSATPAAAGSDAT